MRKILLFLFILTFFSTMSCKKDYPSDIPKWLKEKIKERKRALGGDPYDTDHSIDEYVKNDNGQTIYVIDVACDPGYYEYYDCSGNLLCAGNWVWGTCDLYGYQKMTFVRHIWNDIYK